MSLLPVPGTRAKMLIRTRLISNISRRCSHTTSPSVVHTGAAYAFDPMNGLYINSVGELMAAAETARHNRRTGLAVPNSRKEAVLADLHGKLIVLLFMAKGTGHTTASGIDFGHRDSRHAVEQALIKLVYLAVEGDARKWTMRHTERSLIRYWEPEFF